MASSIEKLRRAFPAVLLALTGIFSLLGYATCFQDPTTPQDWQSAAGFVDAGLEESHRIRVTPSWSEAPLVFLKPESGRQVVRISKLIQEDLVGIPVYWVISEIGRRDEALAAFPTQPSDFTVKEFGSVEVLRVKVPDPKISWVFREHLQDAKVERIKNGEPTHCITWSAEDRRWDCGKREKWLYVADRMMGIGDEPRRCIYLPVLGGRALHRITFSNVPTKNRLRIRAGLTLRATRSTRGEDVDVQVLLDGKRAAGMVIPKADETWNVLEFPTTPGSQEVSIEVSAVNGIDRFVCVDGFVLD